MYRSAVIILLIIFVIPGCNKGLVPPAADTITTLSGTVQFTGKLPPCDSIVILAVVLSEHPPPFTIDSVFANYGKTIFVNQLNTCPLRDTSFTFILAPHTYRYLGVIEKYGRPDSLTADWQIIGFAHTDLDSAMSFTLNEGTKIDTVKLIARFDSLPKQPFAK